LPDQPVLVHPHQFRLRPSLRGDSRDTPLHQVCERVPAARRSHVQHPLTADLDLSAHERREIPDIYRLHIPIRPGDEHSCTS
jgi:hypothetical protein